MVVELKKGQRIKLILTMTNNTRIRSGNVQNGKLY